MKKTIIFIIIVISVMKFSYSQTSTYLSLDKCLDIIEENDSTYVGVGYKIIGSSRQIWFVKMDLIGKIITNKQFSKGLNSTAVSICKTTDSGYILLCNYIDLSKNKKISILKLNSSGTKEWEKNINLKNEQIGNKILQTSDGGYFIYGVSIQKNIARFPLLMIKTDSKGEMQWNKLIDEGEIASKYVRREPVGVLQSNDGAYLISGNKISILDGKSKVWIMKINNDGIKQWEQTFNEATRELAFAKTLSGYTILAYSEKNKNGDQKLIKLEITSNGELSNYKIVGGDVRKSVATFLYTSKEEFKIAGITKLQTTNYIDFWLVSPSESAKIETTVYFEKIGEYKLSDNAKTKLDKLEGKTCKYIIIEGYADAKGDKITNLKLSNKRILSASNYLINKGFDKSKIVSIPYGEYTAEENETIEKEGNRSDRKIIIKTYY